MKVKIIPILIILIFSASIKNDLLPQENEWNNAEKLTKLAYLLYTQNSYQEALPLAKNALVIYERLLGLDHPDLIDNITLLINLYSKMNMHDDAAPLLNQLLLILERIYGVEDPYVTEIRHGLVEAYFKIGKYAEAEPLCKQVLETRENTLGYEHLEVASALNELATIHFRMDSYSKADSLLNRVLTIHEKILGPDHPEVATTLADLGILYNKMKSEEKVIDVLKRAFKIRKQNLGFEHRDTIETFRYLGVAYSNIGHYAKAESLLTQALTLSKKNFKTEDPSYIAILENLASLHSVQKKYTAAIQYYKNVLEIREKTLGNEHPEVVTTLEKLGEAYKALGSYTDAESIYKRLLVMSKKNRDKQYGLWAKSLINLMKLYVDMGAYAKGKPLLEQEMRLFEKDILQSKELDFANAYSKFSYFFGEVMGAYFEMEPLLKRALEISERTYGAENPETATILYALGALYHNSGYDAKSLPLMKRALEIRYKVLGIEHSDVVRTLNGLAAVYHSLGNYATTDSLMRQAIKIAEEKFKNNDTEMAEIFHNQSVFYYALGSYDEAEDLIKRSISIKEKNLGIDHRDLASDLSTLALIYQQRKDFIKADSLFKHALGILEKFYGEEHLDIAKILTHMGSLYQETGLFSEAETLCKRSLSIREKILGPEHPDVAIDLNSLAVAYSSMNLYDKAEPLYKRSLSLLQRYLGADHPFSVSCLNNLAGLWFKMGEIDSCLSVAKRHINLKFNLYHQILPYLSEKHQLDYIEKEQPLAELWPHICLLYSNRYPNIKIITCEMLLNNKGLTYDILTARTRNIRIGDKSITALNDSLMAIKNKIANIHLLGPTVKEQFGEYYQKLQNLINIKEDLETKLATRGYKFESTKEPIEISQVSQFLPKDYVMIDFLYLYRLKWMGEKRSTADDYYLAFIIQPDREPDFINLGKAEPINKIALELVSYIWAGKLNSISVNHKIIESIIKEKSRQLCNQIFKPLLPAIGDKKKIIICADGILNYLPFGILVDEQDHYIIENYLFHYITTGRDVLQWRRSCQNKISEAVIIAAPDFDYLTQPKFAMSAAKFRSYFFSRRSRDWRQMTFKPLKYTDLEAVAIDSLLESRGITTQLYLREKAQESILKNLISPQILHISTHGFFLPDQPELKKATEIGIFTTDDLKRSPTLENPLLRCGLAFAGANYTEFVKEGEDGLATALEIAGLNLEGTDLVTLSACLTGFGELKSSEGVYGLQRSFLLSGAKSVIASLWSVPDLETKDLMIEFYRRYLFEKNISKSEALRQAQLAVIVQLRNKYGAAHPAYWGAFICIGEP